jgi:hypothetical protein
VPVKLAPSHILTFNELAPGQEGVKGIIYAAEDSFVQLGICGIGDGYSGSDGNEESKVLERENHSWI